MSTVSTHPTASPSTLPVFITFFCGVSAAFHIWKLPPALPVLQEELGISLSLAGWLIAVFQIAGMLMGMIFGLFAVHLGLRRSMIIGSLVLGIAACLGALWHNVTVLLILRIIEGFGLLMVTLPAPAFVRQLSPPRLLNFFLGLWSAYIPTATVLTLVSGALMLEWLDWSILWYFSGLFSFVMAFLMWRHVPLDQDSTSSGPKITLLSKIAASSSLIKQTITAKNPWLVALCFSMYTAQWAAIVSFLPIIYKQAGITGIQMGLLTAVVGGSNIIGNLSAGRLLQKNMSSTLLLNTAFITMMLSAIVAFSVNDSPWIQFLAFTLFSAVGGLAPATLFNLAVRLAPSHQTVSTTVGLTQQWISLSQFAGPPMIVLLVDFTHTWQWVWTLTSAWALCGLLLSWQLRSASQHT